MVDSEVYQQALEWGKQHYPKAPEIYHHAFASVVQFGCIGGVRRDTVIQTMRTFVAINKIFKLRAPGKFSFDEVVNLISKDCYGPIKLEHAQVWKQNNFEYEYLDDIEAAQILIAALHPTVIYSGERDQ
ncbi:MAG: hypothetical protein RJB24_50 [Candidatus Parcubacteria bacterium]|jgi:hypothetical protein